MLPFTKNVPDLQSLSPSGVSQLQHLKFYSTGDTDTWTHNHSSYDEASSSTVDTHNVKLLVIVRIPYNIQTLRKKQTSDKQIRMVPTRPQIFTV